MRQVPPPSPLKVHRLEEQLGNAVSGCPREIVVVVAFAPPLAVTTAVRLPGLKASGSMRTVGTCSSFDGSRSDEVLGAGVRGTAGGVDAWSDNPLPGSVLCAVDGASIGVASDR